MPCHQSQASITGNTPTVHSAGVKQYKFPLGDIINGASQEEISAERNKKVKLIVQFWVTCIQPHIL